MRLEEYVVVLDPVLGMTRSHIKVVSLKGGSWDFDFECSLAGYRFNESVFWRLRNFSGRIVFQG